MHLGMKLHGPDAAVRHFQFRPGHWRNSNAAKAGGQFQRFVAVAHPHLQGGRQVGEERRGGVFDGDFGVAVLALGRGAHFAAEVMNDELQAVADAENRHAELKHSRVGRGRVGIVDRRRSAGKNDADGVMALWISASGAVQGSTTEKTFCSRVRRAMS